MGNKTFFWLKITKDFFNQKEIKKLKKENHNIPWISIYFQMAVLCMNEDGYIYYDGIEDSIEEEIALEISEEAKDIKKTIKILEKVKMIATSDNYIFLTRINEIVGKETESAVKMRKLRARKSNNVTKCDQDVIESNIILQDVIKCDAEKRREEKSRVEQNREEVELELEKEKEKQKGLKHDLYNIPKTEIKKENTGCLKNISSSSDLFDVNLFEEKSPERFIEKEVIEKKLTKHIPVIQKLEYTVPLQDQYIHKKLLNSFDNQTCLKAIKITNDRKIAAGPGKIAYALEVARNVEFEDVLLMQPQEYLNYLSDRFKNIDLNALIEFCQSSEQSDTHILKGSSQSVADQSKVKFARICKDFSFKYENGMDVISDRFFKNVKSEV